MKCSTNQLYKTLQECAAFCTLKWLVPNLPWFRLFRALTRRGSEYWADNALGPSGSKSYES